MFRASSTPRTAARRFPRRGALVAAVSTGFLVALPALASADPAVPYKDSNAIGLITLCDQSGKVLTSGSVTSAPFVWSAHTDVAAPQGYGIQGKTAVLAGYQPRQDVDPEDWSGKFISTSAEYTDAAHPTVQSATSDVALHDLVVSFPPAWDHLLQLRVYLGAPGLSTYTDQYAALDLRISDDGQTWTALERGTASCSVGSAVSMATILHLTPPSGAALLPAGKAAAAGSTPQANASSSTAAAAPGASGVVSAAASAAVPVPAGSAPGGSIAASVVSPQLASGTGRSTSSSGRGGAIAAAFVLLAVVAGGWGGALIRGRRIQPVPHDLSRELESR